MNNNNYTSSIFENLYEVINSKDEVCKIDVIIDKRLFAEVMINGINKEILDKIMDISKDKITLNIESKNSKTNIFKIIL